MGSKRMDGAFRYCLRGAFIALAMMVALLWSMEQIRAESSWADPVEEVTAAPAGVVQAHAYRSAPVESVVHSPESPDGLVSLIGYVIEAPLGGLGPWIIQTGPNLLETVIAVDLSIFDGEIPSPDDWVKVDAAINLLGIQIATNITLDLFEEDQVIAQMDSGVISSTIASRYGLLPLSALPGAEDVVLFDTVGQDVLGILSLLLSDTDLLWSELNYILRAPEGDPAKTWGWGGIDPTDYTNQAAFQQVNLGPVEPLYSGQDTVVAILDTGVDYDHPALQGVLLGGLDLIDGDMDPQDESDGFAWGHGTHAAGIVHRVASDAEILPVRVLDPNGRGNAFALAYGIAWAADQGADVINLSLGTDYESLILESVVEYATDQGAIVAAAAGNQNTNLPQWPAAFPSVLGVSAVDGANVKADFSNYGGSWVDIAAPGVGITSTIIGAQGSGYASWSGTSMSTPFVAGAAALAREKWPTELSSTITQWLRDRAQDIDVENPSHAGQLGGLLDVASAMAITQTRTTPDPTTSPEPTATPTATPGSGTTATPTSTPDSGATATSTATAVPSTTGTPEPPADDDVDVNMLDNQIRLPLIVR